MTPTNFFKSIFPSEGKRVLAVFKNGLGPGKAPTHQFFDNDADLLAAAQKYDQRGMNVYHACAVYQTDANRKGENVKALKSLWLDLDVGEKKPYSQFDILARGQFPQPCLRCGTRFTRWGSYEVDDWFDDPAGYIATHAGVPALPVSETSRVTGLVVPA